MVCGCISAVGTGKLQFIEGTMNANMYCDILKQSMIPSLRRLGRRAVFQHYNDHCLAKEAEGKGDGLTKYVFRPKPYWASVGHPQTEGGRAQGLLTSSSSLMSSWRGGRGLQCQPVKLWWTPCPRGLRQCQKVMVASQNIDTLGPIWTFSLRGVLTFVASGLDINGCVLSYFTNLHRYTSCTLTTLHCSKLSFLECCHMKTYNKIFTKNVRGVLTSVRYCMCLKFNICETCWSHDAVFIYRSKVQIPT